MAQSGNRRHLRSRANIAQGRPSVGTLRCGFQADVTLWVDISSIFRRGGVSPPVCRKFYLTSQRRTPEPPLCKGRYRAERGTGVVPDRNYLLFLFCKLQTFTIPQAHTRQLPLLGGAFWGVRTLRKMFCRSQRAGGLFRRLSGFDFLQAGGIWNAP